MLMDVATIVITACFIIHLATYRRMLRRVNDRAKKWEAAAKSFEAAASSFEKTARGWEEIARGRNANSP